MFAADNIRLRALEPEDLEWLYSVENDEELWQWGSSNVPYSRYTLKTYIAESRHDIYADGQLVGESVSGWVLASLEGHKLMRLSSVTELAGTGGGELCKTMTLSKLHCPEELVQVERRPMRYSDSDLNGHVNNTRYADFACDAVEMDRLEEDRFLASMQIGYLAECRPGEQLDIQSGGQGDQRYVRGLDESGKSRFEAALFFGKAVP